MKYLRLFEDIGIDFNDEDWEEEYPNIIPKFKVGDVVKMVNQKCVIVELDQERILSTATPLNTEVIILKIKESINFGYVFEGKSAISTGRWYLMSGFELVR